MQLTNGNLHHKKLAPLVNCELSIVNCARQVVFVPMTSPRQGPHSSMTGG